MDNYGNDSINQMIDRIWRLPAHVEADRWWSSIISDLRSLPQASSINETSDNWSHRIHPQGC